MTEETNQIDGKEKSKSIIWKVLLIFALAIIIVCGIVFLFNYDIAYDNSGFWLPQRFAVIVYYFFILLVSVIAAVLLKLVYKKRASISLLLVTAIILPIMCYQFNFHTLKKDGLLYPLVDEGGIFYFIAIKDFNFDGMNDELYHNLYEERSDSWVCGGHFDDSIIDNISTEVVGIGIGLDGYSSYDWEERVINLHLHRDNVEYTKVTVCVTFQDSETMMKTLFYIDGVEQKPQKTGDKAVTFVFDAETCANWQSNEDKDYFEILIDYVVAMPNA